MVENGKIKTKKEEILKEMGRAIKAYSKKNMLVDVLFWNQIRGKIEKYLTDKPEVKDDEQSS